MARMSDDELVAAIEAEEADAVGFLSGQLASEREDALNRYNGRLYGDERPGRSAFVSADVRDAIEGIMPAIARVFLSGDELGKFDPIGPEDQSYEIESEVVNHYIFVRNDGFSHIYNAIKNALLLKNGYVKLWWQTKEDVHVERYFDQSDDQLALLMQDADVKVVEHSERVEEFTAIDPKTLQPIKTQVMLHDVKVERTKPEEYVALAFAPTEEIRVAANHVEVGLANANFVQHARRITIGELRELGYDAPDDLPSDDAYSGDIERLARSRFSETQYRDDLAPSDATRKIVLLKETWYRGDVSGTGRPELWRVCIVGNRILHKEEADLIPFASFVPIYYPGSHVGISYYDMIADLARVKTALIRQILDNAYLVNNSEKVVNTQVTNLDDWLISRPGGIKQVTGPPGEAYAQLITPDASSSLLGVVEFVEAIKENRTGISRVNQGTGDPNILNRTASGAAMMMTAGQARQELICRCLASGIRDLFLLVHAIALKHSTKPLQIQLQNRWITVNPREWVRRTDFSLSVGLGTGAPEQQMAKTAQMLPMIVQAASMGLAGPEQIYNAGKEFLRAAGYRSTDKFLKAPPPGAQMPQQPNPVVLAEQEKGKVQMAMAQMKGQHDAQAEQMKMQAQQAREAAQAQADIIVQRTKIESEASLELARHKMQNDLDAMRHSREQETAVQIANIKAAADIEIARIKQGIADGAAMAKANADAAGLQMAETMRQSVEGLRGMVEQLTAAQKAPKRIVRDPRTGRAIGIATEGPEQKPQMPAPGMMQ